ncbi:hybrid sensor histidine kinase/response regulator [Aquabacter sediminis]|uniref:hybrid sensor histidine kinase/response regulator n=1 Tax=Aquabacter sediminis TaxID=3029197 RepID=UPI00237E92A6|nr:hybrid sensor histidine kinase/response regulator [Aquabacter sp. P-9]MDE1570570.1 cache domain-containing protein [Aquabacter sp. P-9]
MSSGLMQNGRRGEARSDRRRLIALGACAAVPVVLFGLTAWWDYSREMRAARAEAMAGAYVMAEQADAVFSTVQVVLEQVDQALDDRPVSAVRADKHTHKRLAELQRRFPYMDSIFLVDADGYVAASSRSFPIPPYDVRTREYYTAGKAGHEGLHFSLPYRGPFSRSVSFAASRPLQREGAFGGVVSVTIFPEYFHTLYRNSARTGSSVTAALVRPDGTVIFRSPDARTAGEVTPPLPGLEETLKHQESGILTDFVFPDRSRGIAAFRTLPNARIALLYALNEDDILDEWYRRTTGYGLAALASSLAFLIAFSLAGRRRDLEDEFAWQAAETGPAESLVVAERLPSLGLRGLDTILSLVLNTLAVSRRHASEGPGPDLGDSLEGASHGVEVAQRLVATLRSRGNQARIVNMALALEDLRKLLLGAVWPRLFVQLPPSEPLLDVFVDPARFEVALVDLVLGLREMGPSGSRLVAIPDRRQVRTATAAPVPVGDYVCVEFRLTGEEGTVRDASMRSETRLRLVENFAEASDGALQVRTPDPQTVLAVLWLPAALVRRDPSKT